MQDAVWQILRCQEEKQQKEKIPVGELLASNFCSIVQFVQQHEAHLLHTSELNLMDRYQLISLPAQSLLMRLFARKGPWFRLKGIEYAEVPDAVSAIQELKKSEFVLSQEDVPQEEALGIQLRALNVEELVHLGKSMNLEAFPRRKADLVGFIKRSISQKTDKVLLCYHYHDTMHSKHIVIYGRLALSWESQA